MKIAPIIFIALLGIVLFSHPTQGQSEAVLPVDESACDWADFTGSPFHTGLNKYAMDLNCLDKEDYGMNVRSILDGVVTQYDPLGSINPVCGISIDIWYKTYQLKAHYCHLKDLSGSIGFGSSVARGTLLGHIDTTGTVTGSHLHFVLWKTDASGRAIEAYDPRLLPAFATIQSVGVGTGGVGGKALPPGTIPGIGDLVLQVQWPSVPTPSGSISLNDIVEGPGPINLPLLLLFLYGLFLWIGGVVAFMMLVYAGIMYVLSGNNPGTRARANQQARKIFVGMLILLSSSLILTIIDPSLLNLQSDLSPVSEVELRGVQIGEAFVVTCGEYCPIPFMTNEDAEVQYSDCFSLSETDDQLAIKECMAAKGALVIQTDDDTEPTCASACMLQLNDPKGCRLINEGESEGCQDAWNDMHKGSCQDDSPQWDFEHALCSGIGTSPPGSYSQDFCSQCSVDDKDFSGDAKILCRECVADYVEVAVDMEWGWQACFCK